MSIDGSPKLIDIEAAKKAAAMVLDPKWLDHLTVVDFIKSQKKMAERAYFCGLDYSGRPIYRSADRGD